MPPSTIRYSGVHARPRLTPDGLVARPVAVVGDVLQEPGAEDGPGQPAEPGQGQPEPGDDDAQRDLSEDGL